MEKDKKWRIILTSLNYEQKLVKTFMELGIQSFCPLGEYPGNDHGKPILRKKPLFPGMLFLLVDDDQMKLVSATRHVLRFLYWMNAPAEVSQADISRIYHFTNSYRNIRLEKSMVGVVPSSTDRSELVVQSRLVAVELGTIGYRMTAVREDIYTKKQGEPVLEKNYFGRRFRINRLTRLAPLQLISHD